jgi:phosphate starvation-inducible protein PhoH and related proteins
MAHMSRNLKNIPRYLQVVSGDEPKKGRNKRNKRSDFTNEAIVPRDQQQSYVKNLTAKSQGQKELMESIDSHDVILALGPAGTGKTYIAVAKAVEMLKSGKVGRLVMTRPAVEAGGERIGFLPGGIEDKMDPYMRPLYDALLERVSPAQIKSWIADKVLEIAPLAFMRGRTFANCVIVMDEAQNATWGQLQMVLTRLGFGSKMIVTGDPDQSDLERGDSGLSDMAQAISGKLSSVSVVRLDEADVVRHPTVRALLPILGQRPSRTLDGQNLNGNIRSCQGHRG